MSNVLLKDKHVSIVRMCSVRIVVMMVTLQGHKCCSCSPMEVYAPFAP